MCHMLAFAVNVSYARVAVSVLVFSRCSQCARVAVAGCYVLIAGGILMFLTTRPVRTLVSMSLFVMVSTFARGVPR